MARKALTDVSLEQIDEDNFDSFTGPRKLAPEPEQALINDRSRYIIEEEDDEETDLSIRERGAGKNGTEILRYTLVLTTVLFLVGFVVLAVVLVALSTSIPITNHNSTNHSSTTNLEWWKTTVIYQCYPRSFKDSSGDGNGDITGILNKVDYLHDIGIKTVWLNPIFKSPKKDNGYDISNYVDVDSLYGSMDDLKKLLATLHDKAMHLLLDFVPNHTSDEHEWFVDSRSSRNSSKRDWYVWADPGEDGGPPNNWISLFGGSSWSYDQQTKQYYLHQFSDFQPDLNYRNPEVRQAMENVIRFWLDLGVDGFRIDAVIFLLEDEQLRSEPIDPSYVDTLNCSANNTNKDCYNSLDHIYTKDIDGIHDIIRSWRNLTNSYTDSPRFMVGETYDPVDLVMKYYGTDNDEFNFPFNFLLLNNDEWTGTSVSDKVAQWMDALPEGAWPNWVLGNHDNARIPNKAGNYLARALNVLLLTLPGTSTTYYGEEIFMTDVHVPPDRRNDIYEDRDKERTPMQWDSSSNAGFTSNTTSWLPVADNFTNYNVEVESSNSSSMLSLYKRVLKLITEEEPFRYAEYEEVMNSTELFAYRRFHNGTESNYVVIINFSRTQATADLSFVKKLFPSAVVELSSVGSARDGTKVDLASIQMAPGEALVIQGYSAMF